MNDFSANLSPALLETYIEKGILILDVPDSILYLQDLYFEEVSIF